MSRRTDAGQTDVEARAEALLSGARVPSAAELLDLVHAVNPTGRALPDRVVERRYTLKSRLQSLLVRAYADDLRVEPQADPGVVALDHRFSGRDACHARVEDLDEDARALVRFRLDTQDAQAARPVRRRAGHGEPAGALARGRAALAEWDLDRARECFEAALAESQGGTAAAAALAELLVDRLGLDADALALEPSLGPEAKAAVAVRSRLALAAARSGNAREARRWLAGVRGTPAADALVAIARLALGGHDLDGARGALEALREADGAHADLAAIANEIDRRRAEDRRPMEEALERACAAGEPDLERHARELLAAHPDSALARRVLDRCGERARRVRRDELVSRAKEALERGSDEAAALLGQAAALVPGDAELAALLARAEGEARTRASRRRVERVLAALAAPGDGAGLAEWMALAPGERGAVRERCNREELTWFDGLDVPDSGARQRALVEAARALLAARRALAAGNPAEAARRLATPHARELGPGAELLRAAERELAERRVTENVNRFGAMLARFNAEARPGHVPPLDEDVDPELLPADVRPLWDRWSARRRDLDRHLERVRRANGLVNSGEYLEGRRVLEALESGRDDPAFAELDRQAVQGIRRAWLVRTERPQGDWASTRHPALHLARRRGAPSVVELDEQGRVYLANMAGTDVLLAELDAATGRVTRLCRTRAPAPMDNGDIFLSPGRVWLVSTEGKYAAFDTDELLPAVWHDGPPVRDFEIRSHWVPDGRALWVVGRRSEKHFAVRCDLETWKRMEEPRPVEWMTAFCAPEPGVGLQSARSLDVAALDGAVRRSFPLAGRDAVVADLHPSGRGWLTTRFGSEGEGSGVSVRAHTEADAGPEVVVGAVASVGASTATSLEAGLMFVLGPAPQGPWQLLALEPAGDSMRLRWQCVVPDRAQLAGDRLGRRAALAWNAASGVGTALLGAKPPVIPDEDMQPRGDGRMPPLSLESRCGTPDCWVAERALTRSREEAGGRPAKLARLLRQRLGGKHPDELEWAIQAADPFDPAELRSLAHLAGDGPSPATVRLWRAQRLALDGEWEKALAMAPGPGRDAPPGPPLEGAALRHCAHLRGLALVHLGRWDEARRLWSEAAEGEPPSGTCRLSAAVEWLDAVRAPPGTPGRGLAGRVTAAVVAHDAARAAGDVQAALRAVWCAAVFRAEEKQSFARLAEALMELPACEGPERLWREHLLNRAVGVLCAPGTNLWLPGAWGDERLQDLAQRVGRHLQEMDERWVRELPRPDGSEPDKPAGG